MNKKTVAPESRKKGTRSFSVTGIGASAGGIEAMTELLRHLSPTTGMAFVYIQHLDPNHESMLTAILGRATKMKVVEATNGMRIEPDHLYIIPPNQEMSVADGLLTLTLRKERPAVSMPVDDFFNSLADAYQQSAIGVVLSGNA